MGALTTRLQRQKRLPMLRHEREIRQLKHPLRLPCFRLRHPPLGFHLLPPNATTCTPLRPVAISGTVFSTPPHPHGCRLPTLSMETGNQRGNPISLFSIRGRCKKSSKVVCHWPVGRIGVDHSQRRLGRGKDEVLSLIDVDGLFWPIIPGIREVCENVSNLIRIDQLQQDKGVIPVHHFIIVKT